MPNLLSRSATRQPAGVRAAGARRDAGAGARRALDDRQPGSRTTIPTPTRASADGDDLQRALQRRPDPARLPGADGRGRLRPADCLRQRRQPAARALGGARARDVGAGLARRHAAGASSGSCSSRACCSRSSAALLGLALAAVGVRLFDAGDDRRRQAVLDSVHDGRARLRVLRRGLPRHRRRVRPRAGAARVEDQPQRGAEGRRPRQQRRRPRAALDRRADRRRDRADARAAGRRRAS